MHAGHLFVTNIHVINRFTFGLNKPDHIHPNVMPCINCATHFFYYKNHVYKKLGNTACKKIKTLVHFTVVRNFENYLHIFIF